jgi:hypothetical protein
MKRPLTTLSAAAARSAPVTVDTREAAAEQPTALQPREIVVPVKLPPGGVYEIVIRVQLDTTP